MSKLIVPEVVVLHSGEPDLMWYVAEVGLKPPLAIRSFTDLHPNINPLNEGLETAITRADHIIVNPILLEQETESALTLRRHRKVGSFLHKVIYYDDGKTHVESTHLTDYKKEG